MLVKDHSDSLVLIVLRIVLRTVLKWEQDHPEDRAQDYPGVGVQSSWGSSS